MNPVLQEIIEMANAKLKEALEQELEFSEEWDADAFEQKVREFTQEIGKNFLQIWAEAKAKQAEKRASLCSCGGKPQRRKYKLIWWLTTFGRIEVEASYFLCPRCHKGDCPFQRLTGIRCRGKSKALERALTDFGAEKSFAQASKQLREHYGVEVHPSSVRQVVERQAKRAEELVTAKHKEAVQEYLNEDHLRQGEPWLIVESDGSKVRTGELFPGPEGELTPKRQIPKRRRETQWREVRLSTVQRVGVEERLYGAILGTPEQVGEQMFALALLSGWGENTRVHGIGDGAPWIARQMKDVFFNCQYLLDRYHLLEHLYDGAEALPPDYHLPKEEWVKQQIELIDSGEVKKVIASCNSLSDGNKENKLSKLAGYLEERQGYLDYVGARELGLPEGSGAVEGGHRHVIQERLKLPGTWWREETLNPMLALRTLRANNWWEEFWN